MTEKSKSLNKAESFSAVTDWLSSNFIKLADHSLQGIFIYQEDKHIYANKALLEMFEITLDQYLNIPPKEFFLNHVKSQKSLELLKSKYQDHLDGIGDNFHYQLEIVTAKGKKRWLDLLTQSIEFMGEPAGYGVMIDITEQTEIDIARIESEEKYRMLIEQSHDAVYIITDNKFSFVNSKFVEMFGYSEKELLSPDFHFMQLVAPSSKTLIEKRLKLIDDKQPLPNKYEYTAITREGKELNLRVSVSHIHYKGKRVVQGVYEDITRQKKAEAALAESEEHYRAIWENSPIGMSLTDINGFYHYANPAYCRIYGFANDELIGNNFNDLIVTPEKRSHNLENYKKAFAKGDPIALDETEFVTKDGSRRTIHYAGDFVRLNNIPRFLVAMNIDITDHKSVSEEYRQFKIISEQANTGIAIADLNGNILYLNNYFADIHGYKANDLIGKNLSLFHTPRQLKSVIRINQRLLEDSEYRSLKVWHVHKNGTEFPMLMNGVIINDNEGKPVCLAATAVDITESEANQRLVDSQNNLIKKLAAVSNLKEALLMCIDHAISISKMDCGAIYLVDNENGFKLAAGKGISEEAFAQVSYFEFGSPEAELIMRGEPHYAEEVGDLTPSSQVLSNEGLKANIAIPIKNNDEIISSFNLASHYSSQISESTKKAIESLAMQIGSTISRLKTETELNKIQYNYQLVVENSNEAIAIVQDFKVKFFNPQLVELFKYNNQEIKTKSLLEVIAFEYREKTKDIYYKRISGENVPKKYRIRMLRKDGKQLWIEVKGAAINWEGENAALVFLSDVTDEEEAAQNLKQERSFVDSLLETANSLIVCLDKEARIIVFNREIEKVSGYRREAVIGKKWHDVFPQSQDIPGNIDDYSEWLKASFHDMREDQLLTKSGDLKTILWSNSILTTADSDKYTIISVGQDITGRKKVEKALEENEERYRLLIENAGEPITTIRRDGKFLMMNQAAARYFGGLPDDFVGQTMWDLFPEKIANRQMNTIKESLDSKIRISTTSNTIINGEEKWFINNMQPLNVGDHPSESILLISSDITEQKQAEIRQEARIKLLEQLRNADSINLCLGYGCEAINNARLYKRSVMTLHSQNREITNIGYFNLDDETVKAALSAYAPDTELKDQITDEKFKLESGFFIPVEEGLFQPEYERIISEDENNGDHYHSWRSGDEFFIPIRKSQNEIVGWLSVDTPFKGTRPGTEEAIYLQEIVDLVNKQISELRNLELIKEEQHKLKEKNITLRVVLASIEQERIEIKLQVAQEIENNLMPMLKRITDTNGTVNKTYYSLLENNLQSMADTTGGLHHLMAKLSPRELEICKLIRGGHRSKDIAELLNISPATVQKHRELIRKRLGLTNKKINLSSFLNEQNSV